MPADAFTACPACGCQNNLRQISLDVYCHECGWDSSSAFVESGGLDQMIYDFEEMLAQEDAKRIFQKPSAQRLAV
jgi:hypothetical protein